MHSDIQVCTLHKLKSLERNLNKFTNLSKKERFKIVKDAANIYNVANKTAALNKFICFKNKYYKIDKHPIDCFENNSNLTLTFSKYPNNIQKSIKTNNLIEQLNRAAGYLLGKYLYFHERDNARVTLFTFVCGYEQKHSKSSDAVSLSVLENFNNIA